RYFFVGETLEALAFFSLVAVISQGRTIFPRARRMVAAISCNCITARTFAGNGRRARACRRCSLAANILAISGLTPSTASIYPQVDVGSEYRQAARDRGEPVRGALQLSRDPWRVRSANRSRSDVLLAPPVRAHLRNRFRAPVRAPLR